MSESSAVDFDIIIAGGGMIGTSLALALAPLELRVAVVEPIARDAPGQPSFDDRSTALSRSSQRLFEAIGLWPDVESASTPIHRINVSDQGRFGFARIDANEQGVEALGYVVINRVLGGVLQSALDQCTAVDFMCPAKIVAVDNGKAACTVDVEADGRTKKLNCHLLVAADGAASSVRDLLGISASRVDYGQWAIIGNLQPGVDHAYRAFERFTTDGPLALLPADNGRMSFVWIQSESSAKLRLEASDQVFLHGLQTTFGDRLGTFSRVGKRAAFLLALTRARGLIAQRGVVVGNAAHGLHPVAAQGFNLGLRDVAALCDCIADLPATNPPGGAAMLEAYAEWRAADHDKVVRFTDGLVRLFGDERPASSIARNIGMLAFDIVPGIRGLFARHTMGLAGRLPRLSRGVPLV